ncbi:DUF2189 domain-containing protein [Defluviicoccus vanus]|uniref:DUF2189 domain-containing protein n=1 Tax=Defluviicoccus vanus TaxID=111831 RepID=A0A7H1N5N9_9PROT|nr:DUF2189 domain-containing protein [Defluviicoccus vanus]QNT71025.1 DUF2189 domain-containing protein [Defluviicoccus vanus]
MSGEPTPVIRPNTLPYADRVIIVGSDAPFGWLAAGWRDFRRAGLVSFLYGLLIAATGLALTVGLYLADLAYLIAPLVAGFMLVGPALTVGLYAISRDLEAGRRASLGRALAAWRKNSGRFLGMGLLLVAFLIVWLRFAALIFAVSFPYKPPELSHLLTSLLFTVDGLTFLGIGTVVGAGMATIVFSVSVVSLPMLLDRDVDILQAIVTSVVCVMMNARVMAVWAALIVLFTAAGLLTAYVGLAVTLPLIGHASWHAYRALIRPAG